MKFTYVEFVLLSLNIHGHVLFSSSFFVAQNSFGNKRLVFALPLFARESRGLCKKHLLLSNALIGRNRPMSNEIDICSIKLA